MPAPLKGTFYAFRPRGQAGVLTIAALVHGLLALATIASFVLANYQLFAASFYGTPLAGGADPNAPFVRLGLTAAALALIYMLVTASYEAALLRWMIRGEAGRFGGFSLGGDTWRVFGGNLIWLVVVLIAFVCVSFLMGLIYSSPLSGELQRMPYRYVMMFGPFLVWALLLTPLGVRMGTGNAASVVRRRFSYLQSWRISDKRGWALLGSYLLLWLAVLALLAPPFWGLRMWIFETQLDPRYSSARILTAEGRIAMTSVSTGAFFLSNILVVLLLAGVNARAVLAAVEDGKIEGVSANVAQVFD